MNKREHYRRAKAHLDAEDDERLAYAALELRMCLEAIIYSKLKTYAKRLPTSVKKKWQPPQALKALLTLEPDADRDFNLRMVREAQPGATAEESPTSLHSHRTVKYRWLRKHYNKLGSYLHVSQPFAPPKVPYRIGLKRLREALEEITEELEPVVASTMDASLAMTIGFECVVCRNQVLCNEAGLERTSAAVCLDPDCETEYEAARDDEGEWIFTIPRFTFICDVCKQPFEVEDRQLELGLEITCEECNTCHRLRYVFTHDKKADGEETSS